MVRRFIGGFLTLGLFAALPAPRYHRITVLLPSSEGPVHTSSSSSPCASFASIIPSDFRTASRY
jgi:hypothetical protein